MTDIRLIRYPAATPTGKYMDNKQTIYYGNRAVQGDEVRLNAARAAAGFKAMGLQPGDAVAVMLRNDVPYLELILALNQLGVHLVAVNWHFKREEAGYILRDSGARAVVVHADFWPEVAEVVPEGIPVLVVSVAAEIRAAYGIADAPVPVRGQAWESWRDDFAPNAEAPMPSVGSMLYTSGTTGRPKAVMRLPGTPRQHEGTLRVRRMASRARSGMRTVIVGPLYHAGPNSAARVALQMAEVLVVMPRFDAEQLLKIIQQHRITHLSLVPIMLVRLLKLPEAVRARYDVSSLENVTHGGSPCAPEVKRRMIEWWGPILNETYGSTETSLVTFISSDEWLQRPGSVGRPFPGTSIRILDEEGRELPAGEVGEVYVHSGENALPFTYRNNPQARQAIERGGYVTNGDMGYCDEGGYLYITDRKRDMVISGGVNVYPAEIEHILLAHGEVHDCAVFGIPDAEYGEALAAAVVRAPGSQISAADLREWLQQQLAGYKIPKVIDFHASLPRESMGKVFKNQLRAPYWERAGRRI